eukprot:Rhum_TRINITY_DN19070_c0_g1::Rhum_TRINITY_DN19070_c0_g1_i1::g.169202::m.169202
MRGKARVQIVNGRGNAEPYSSFTSFCSVVTSSHTSWKELYMGTGGSLRTSGGLLSQTMPHSSICACSTEALLPVLVPHSYSLLSMLAVTSSPTTRIDSCAPRRSMFVGDSTWMPFGVSVARRCSRYPVSSTDFFRRRSMPMPAIISRHGRMDAMHATLGFDSWNDAAPSVPLKLCFRSKRDCLALPHQPSSLSTFDRSTSLCTKAPPMLPGPEHMYLYVHQHAKSTFQSCSFRMQLPAAWARSHPTTQPCFFATAVMRSMSKNWPVRKWTPASITMAISSPRSSIVLMMSSSSKARTSSSMPTSMRSSSGSDPFRRSCDRTAYMSDGNGCFSIRIFLFLPTGL